MKLKYYLRGLGIGIIVTAMVLGVSLNKTEKIEEIPQKDSVLSELEGSTEEKSSSGEIIQSEGELSIQEPSVVESSEEKLSKEETSEQETSEPRTQEKESLQGSEETLPEVPSSAELHEEGKLIPIVINNGDGSNRVSKKLADANLVESAASYDQFLCQNGYDKRLVAGTHMIPVDATDEEIAKILCSRN